MNSQANLNLLKQLLTFFGALLTGAGWMSAGQSATLASDITIAVPALISIGSVLWSVYSHLGMKKVPVDSTAIVLPATVTPPPVGSEINLTPLKGAAQVVG